MRRVRPGAPALPCALVDAPHAHWPDTPHHDARCDAAARSRTTHVSRTSAGSHVASARPSPFREGRSAALSPPGPRAPSSPPPWRASAAADAPSSSATPRPAAASSPRAPYSATLRTCREPRRRALPTPSSPSWPRSTAGPQTSLPPPLRTCGPPPSSWPGRPTTLVTWYKMEQFKEYTRHATICTNDFIVLVSACVYLRVATIRFLGEVLGKGAVSHQLCHTAPYSRRGSDPPFGPTWFCDRARPRLAQAPHGPQRPDPRDSKCGTAA